MLNPPPPFLPWVHSCSNAQTLKCFDWEINPRPQLRANVEGPGAIPPEYSGQLVEQDTGARGPHARPHYRGVVLLALPDRRAGGGAAALPAGRRVGGAGRVDRARARGEPRGAVLHHHFIHRGERRLALVAPP